MLCTDACNTGKPDGGEVPLDAMLHDPPGAALCTVEIRGTGEPEAGFTLPFRGERLSGDALARRLDSWVEAGALEPSAADRVRTVMAHPEWLRLDGQTVAVLGAGRGDGAAAGVAALGSPGGRRRPAASGGVAASAGSRPRRGRNPAGAR